MDWFGLLSLFSGSKDNYPPVGSRIHVPPQRISVAAIKRYDAMVMELATDKIKLKLAPLVTELSEEERARTMQIVEVILTEMGEAIQAMETVRGRQ